MENKIIKSAILFPHAYPWAKENLDKNKDELDRVLGKYNLLYKKERRTSIWKINYSIFKYSIGLNTVDEAINKILSESQDKPYLNYELIKIIMKNLALNTDDKLRRYNDLVLGNTSKDEIAENIDIYLNWLTEIALYCFAAGSDMGSRDLENQLLSILNNRYKFNGDLGKKFKNLFHGKGLLKYENMEMFDNTMMKFKDEAKVIFEKVYTEKKKEKISNDDFGLDNVEDFNLDEIFDVMNNSTALNLTDEEIKAQNNIKKENEFKQENKANKENESKMENQYKKENKAEKESVNEEKAVKKCADLKSSIETKEDKSASIDMTAVMKNMKALNDSLGLQTADDNQIIVEKMHYENLKKNESKILRELVSKENEYILSQLYNAYKNIETISKENLEVILFNFFNTLSFNGLEIIENGKNVGDKIEVDTDDVLKDYVFDRPVDVDGCINGIVLYKGWSYKEKQILPMVVKPNKN